MKRAAFFDLDRTLIDCNSGLLWAKYEREQGNITLWQYAQAGFWGAMYHLSLIDMEKTFASATRYYEGDKHSELTERTEEWFHDEVAHRLRDGAEAAIADHREAGHPLVILTNSTCFEAEVAAETWGFDDWLANNFPTDGEGRLVGGFESPLCYGEGKVERAEAWADGRSVDLDASYFYSDSLSDLPMLERVGEPRIVEPDPRLRREAERRGWPILDW